MNTKPAEVTISYKSKVRAADRPQVRSSHTAYTVLWDVWDKDSIEHVESFYILLLNRANKVLGYSLISKGGTAGTVVDPKLIFQIALKTNASAIILAHNHPSGNKKPSAADESITRRLKDAGDLLELKIIDHLIISPEKGEYHSFADEGLL